MGLINKLKGVRYLFLKKKKNKKLNKIINKYIDSKPNIDVELKSALEFYKTNQIQTFPYEFVNKYRNQKIDLYIESGSFYITINGCKMHLRKDWSEDNCKAYIKTLFIEQDPESPHSYCSKEFEVSEEEVLIDIGAAEGFFCYLNYHISKEIYAFEMNQKWIDALKRGFKIDDQKLRIYHGKLGNSNKLGNFKLDDFKELFHQKLFIKMDVEGSEKEVFEGMYELLRINQNIKIAVCTYHKKDDAKNFEIFLKEFGFKTSFSNGYMLYQNANDIEAPFLRKGVLRAWK